MPNLKTSIVALSLIATPAMAGSPATVEHTNPMLTYVHAFRALNTIPQVNRGSGWTRAIGFVEVYPGVAGATAWIYNDGTGCYAITNYHVAFFNAGNSRAHPFKIGFGQGNDDGFEMHVNAFPTGGASQPRTGNEWCGNDWVVLRLSPCVGQRFGALDISDVNLNAVGNQRLSMAGYGAYSDYHRGINYEASCPGVARTLQIGGTAYPNVMQHYCTALGGSSGSPIVLAGRVIAMNCGDSGGRNESSVEAVNDPTRWNVAVVMNQVAYLIGIAIVADYIIGPLMASK